MSTRLPPYLREHTPPSYVTNLDRCGHEVRASCRRGDFTDAVEIIRARLTAEGYPVPLVEAKAEPTVRVVVRRVGAMPKHRRPGPPDQPVLLRRFRDAVRGRAS